ncbi:CPBP family intramembrane glutamic endopeptidase [Mucilaginibacter segetis]|uniref:CPBP family intramembrane metalloprotease n=1 Tax=Mucilaginibacter segetis TaxID=2793071 RepID=A0A934PUL6_9SPHI|nr:CPBP family intramembrane glutamic endopeptidase [Mucilaginibacter segetis]MBK0381123.1 CPBP family intramembrane metalloprotease [Mucilaginibacter segetis]
MVSEEISAEVIESADQKNCISCNVLIAVDCRFCGSCGAKQYLTEPDKIGNQWLLLKQSALFYAITLIICCASKFFDVFQTFSWLLFFSIALAVNSLAFFLIYWKENKKLLNFINFSIQKASLYGAMAMMGAILVHYSVSWLNLTIFSREENYYYLFKGNFFAELLIVFFTAVMPALFEELGFRGYLLGTLLKVADKEQAIYISAFLFAIIHLSFISLFWLIPFALFIAHVRIRENTLWYGIFFHFFFNLTACLFELL